MLSGKSIVVKVLWLLVMTALVYSLGYLRNFIFVTINAESSSVYYHDTQPDIPGFLQFITTMDYRHLIRLKWALTLVFTILFCLVALLSLFLSFKNRLYIKVCLVFYIVVSIISILFMVLGWIIPPFSTHGYNIARNLIHIVQSPFTVLLLIMVAYYHKRIIQA